MPDNLLRPYGEPPKPAPVGNLFVYEDRAVTIERAQQKLQAWQGGENQDTPAGRAILWPMKVAWVGWLIILFGVALSILSEAPHPLAITGPAGLALIALAATVWRRSAPTTPEACMREFAHAINRGDYGRAWRLLAPVDRDVWLRAAPTATPRELDKVMVRPFINKKEFSAYWMAARVPGLTTRIKLKVRPEPIRLSDDAFLVCVLVLPLASMRPEAKEGAIETRKLLLRHGDEWRVFDGELMPATERNVDWLPPDLQSSHEA